MRIIILLFLFLTSTSVLSGSQILKGKITTKAGDPIRYATVYIQELRQGTTSNTKGDYEIRLPAGKYTVIYQSLGYEPVIVNITLSDKTITKDVILQVQYYEIPEVRITASGEDPAYIIMRKVIGMAPYYLNNISYYKADVYLKGNLVIKKIPKLLQKSMRVQSNEHETSVSVGGGKHLNEEKLIKEGDSYLMESFNEMEFTAPDKYFQKVISYNSTFPEQGNNISPMDFIQASFYQPVLADIAISPLSPAAFSHYNFKYLGASSQDNFTIDKIQVIPKRKSQQLFEGTIYIIEDLWCLHSVDLSNENLAGRLRIEQLFIPVQDEVWMPVSHKFEINISIVGFKADAGYGSSVKYVEVKPNLALERPKTISTDFTGKRSAAGKPDIATTKSQQQIGKILEKDELSNRDMVKLSRLMAKESEKSLPDSTRSSLEIKDNTTQIVEKDAANRDSSYWAQIRPIPLSEIEIRSIRTRDSVKSVLALEEIKTDTTFQSEKKNKSKFSRVMNDVWSGHTWSDTSGTSFTFGGLFDIRKFSFNTVDGFVYGTDFRFSKKWKNGNSLSLYPDVNLAINRKSLMWRINGNFDFDKPAQKQIFFRTGISSKDIGTGGGINTLLNTATSLLARRNYLKLYETRFLTLGFRREIIDGLKLEISAGYEDRRVLYNTTNFSFFKPDRSYSANVPDNVFLQAGSNPVNNLRDQRHIDFVTNVTYTPRQKYRICGGKKIPEGSDWPTFNLTWKHGINEFSELADSYKHFDMIKFEVYKSHEFGAFSEFRWRVRTGGFLNNTYLTYYDFFHFNPQQFPVLLDNYHDAFMLPAYYSLSTPEFFGEAHIKYTTPYMFLKFLPGLSKTLMRENLSLSYLGSRYNTNYTEIGYSISEIFFVAELGIYVGFDDFVYKSAGGKLILRFN
jgi:hypothetical protein